MVGKELNSARTQYLQDHVLVRINCNITKFSHTQTLIFLNYGMRGMHPRVVLPPQVALLLQSCRNRVPEALSLLWAGLPPPTSSTPSSLRVWHRLCLPLLTSAENVPRQVFSFVAGYSCTMLW